MSVSAGALRYPVNTLASFHYYKKVDIGKLADGGLRLIGDSGAFSAASQGTPIDLDEFVAWAHRWRPRLAWVAALDVIGDPDATWRNWRTLTRSHGLDTIPTVHYGGDPKLVDRYVEAGVDYLGLGGMVAYKGEPERLLRWCLQVMRYARDNHPHLRFHGWGVTHQRLITTLPWYSVDSSGWGESYRYGKLTLFDPARGRFVTAKADGRDVFKHAALLRRHYGTAAADLAKIGPHNRPLAIRVSAHAYHLLEEHLRRRAQVPAPSYGLNPAAGMPAGVNVHLVIANAHGENTSLIADGPHVHLADAGRAAHLEGSARHPRGGGRGRRGVYK